MIKVKQLRDLLAERSDDEMVILARGGEGNGFSPLAEVDLGAHYAAETAWSGYVTGSADEPHDEQGVPAVVLWPTN